MRVVIVNQSDEFGVLRAVRNVDLERLCTDIVLFDEVPVGLGHLVGIEERLVVAVREPLTDVQRVDLPVDAFARLRRSNGPRRLCRLADDVRDVNVLGADLGPIHRHPVGGKLRSREPDRAAEAPYCRGHARENNRPTARFEHISDRLLRTDELAATVDRPRPFEFLDAHVHEALLGGGTGIIHEDIDRTERFSDCLEPLPYLTNVCKISLNDTGRTIRFSRITENKM